MNTSGKTILVAGATGRQGGAVIRHLLNGTWNVRALTRTPGSLSAQKLSAEGIAIAEGDMADTSSLRKAMEGCYGVYSMQNYFEYGGEKEILYGHHMVDAAKTSGIAHFIFGSVAGADAEASVPHFKTKHVVEEYLRSAGLSATILRPVKFMENYYLPQVFRGILGGTLFDAITPDKNHQMIAVEDVGAYVADAFAHPEDYSGRTLEVAGDEMTNPRVAGTMSDVLGRPVRHRTLPMVAAKILMDREIYLMFKWFNEFGFNVDIAKNMRDFPRVRPTTLRQWLLRENWDRWNKKGSV
jgi:uncharacterized protein YbjT (DUF2867 family)